MSTSDPAGKSGPVPAWARVAELLPDWDAPPRVKAFVTGRHGGVSRGPWGLADGSAGGLNLGRHCGDDPTDVACNRARLEALLPSPPRWLRQVHGTAVHVAAPAQIAAASRPEAAREDDPREPEADAAVTGAAGVVLAVLTADCLPVLLADTRARAVAVAHAGWRGLAAGVVERSVDALREQAGRDAELIAWLGPAIGPRAFEVGDDVVHAFCDQDRAAAAAFVRGPREGKWLADLYRLARIRLARVGVSRVSGGEHCTVHERERFYSHRRDRVSGRMASLIWLDSR
ncbi:MAG TPA: peptidoglycan editing factor PgeF [Burkholderiaceae bacterium]|jgi:YfiH family protein|nr:peptidoglycan editing factor PgeF [Burkholderiaceae bacterium]